MLLSKEFFWAKGFHIQDVGDGVGMEWA